MTSEIHFERLGNLGQIVLDRPKALNALTLDQIHLMHPQLEAWAKDDGIAAVVIEGAGEKAFCAGGDIKLLHEACKAGELEFVAAFYRDEYRLNRRIKTMPKPYIAFIDGIVMGGGVGVSVHGKYRIATERTLFAMPETGIGFFPDVGGSHFLPHLPGAIGQYLGLTGTRLKAADTLHVGVATHYVNSERMPALREALSEARDAAEVEAILSGFASDPGPAPLDDKRALIDRCFGQDSLDAVFAALEAESDPFAAETLAALRAKSPHLVAVSFEMIKRGRTMGFDECMRMEFRLALALAPAHDFVEGIRALLIDRDNAPKWRERGSAAEVLAAFDAVPGCGDLSF
ncbi:enoyl-CoA hydratase/isomerase family protein [Paramagnetospirillum kuznetsovii]|uniref:3-hydroxyisobutyryl-CoA hydrolase n=1 Tax=Paramagnetospirillum kuznetsovii TaxID=2053833 RepID=A0A364NY60_9PROT|nr:enoyl-CoA hydratase/isomerase family protein [Paramagnetospirillum kuznetsovii]RAU22011.1 enoyl-CoA hydratase/isomerase family protein [Paramagnetospirillum kuznetsovii]